jgi:hypothetical protein
MVKEERRMFFDQIDQVDKDEVKSIQKLVSMYKKLDEVGKRKGMNIRIVGSRRK